MKKLKYMLFALLFVNPVFANWYEPRSTYDVVPLGGFCWYHTTDGETSKPSGGSYVYDGRVWRAIKCGVGQTYMSDFAKAILSSSGSGYGYSICVGGTSPEQCIITGDENYGCVDDDSSTYYDYGACGFCLQNKYLSDLSTVENTYWSEYAADEFSGDTVSVSRSYWEFYNDGAKCSQRRKTDYGCDANAFYISGDGENIVCSLCNSDGYKSCGGSAGHRNEIICKSGYYATDTGCALCPQITVVIQGSESDGEILSPEGATSITQCYLREWGHYTDDIGTFYVRENCTYKD